MQLALIKKMDFKFSNLMHSALVSISGNRDEMFIHVQLIHSFLKKVFGVEHIRFYNERGALKVPGAKHPFVYQVAELVNSKLKEDLNLKENNCLHIV
jgi:hypothetical protein